MSTSHSMACLHLAILPPFLPEITMLASSFIRVRRYKPSPSDQNSKPLPTLWVDSSLSNAWINWVACSTFGARPLFPTAATKPSRRETMYAWSAPGRAEKPVKMRCIMRAQIGAG